MLPNEPVLEHNKTTPDLSEFRQIIHRSERYSCLEIPRGAGNIPWKCLTLVMCLAADFPAHSGLPEEMTVKLDQRTGQCLIKAAMRERRPPGKYDLFAWKEGAELQTLAVAWKTFTKRSVALETSPLCGEDIQTNAEPLPNGIERNLASYIGSFRVDKQLDPEEP